MPIYTREGNVLYSVYDLNVNLIQKHCHIQKKCLIKYLGPKARSRGHIKLTITQRDQSGGDCVDLARDDEAVSGARNVALNLVRGGQIPEDSRL